MALPTGMKQFTLTFGPAGVLGIEEPLAVRATVVSASNALWLATGQPFLLKPQVATADLGQAGSMTLISPDQDGFSNGLGQQLRNWTYAVHLDFLDSNGTVVASADKNFAYLTSMGSSIDLDLTTPVSSNAGVVVDIPTSNVYDGGTEY
jgi:hypothetical protein